MRIEKVEQKDTYSLEVDNKEYTIIVDYNAVNDFTNTSVFDKNGDEVPFSKFPKEVIKEIKNL